VYESHAIYYRVDDNGIFIIQILGPGEDPIRHLQWKIDNTNVTVVIAPHLVGWILPLAASSLWKSVQRQNVELL